MATQSKRGDRTDSYLKSFKLLCGYASDSNSGHRDIGDLIAQWGIIVSDKTIRRWCNKFVSK